MTQQWPIGLSGTCCLVGLGQLWAKWTRSEVDLNQLWVKWYLLPGGSGPTLGQVDLVSSGSEPTSGQVVLVARWVWANFGPRRPGQKWI